MLNDEIHIFQKQNCSFNKIINHRQITVLIVYYLSRGTTLFLTKTEMYAESRFRIYDRALYFSLYMELCPTYNYVCCRIILNLGMYILKLTCACMIGDKLSSSSTTTKFLRGRGWNKKVSPSSKGMALLNSGSSSSSPR